MKSSLSKKEEFLIKEYEQAAKLTFHIDELRNKLTSFWITFIGIAVAGFWILLKGEGKDSDFLTTNSISFLLSIICILSAIVIGILGRLRKAQIEHFRIINNIRTYFLGKDLKLWNVVQLSSQTLPKPNRRSGTYLWTLLIILSSSILISVSFNFSVSCLFSIKCFIIVKLLTVVVFLSSFILYDRLYFICAKPPKINAYSEHEIPY